MTRDTSIFLKAPYDVISENEVEKLHQLTMDVLSKKGILFQYEGARDALAAYGARVSGDIVYLDEVLVEKALASAPTSFTIQARGGYPAVTLGEEQKKPVICPGNGTVYIVEKDGHKRNATFEDFDNITKLCETSPVMDMVGAIPVEPSDADGKARHLELAQHLMRHSNKPLIGVATDTKESESLFTMLEMVYGEGYLKENHVIAFSPNPTSPLCYDPLTSESLMAYAKYNQVNMALSAPMAGLTAPLDMHGMVAIINAEVLAGLVLSQAVNPGAPFIYSCGGLTSNMQWANSIGAAPEGSLVNMAVMQMARHYRLPSRAMAGISEAKDVDYQAAMETAQNYLTLNMCGVQMVNETVGVMDALMSTSYEKWILDEELLMRTDKMSAGLGELDYDGLWASINNVNHGGTYLMEPLTLKNCRNNWTPTVSTWKPCQDLKKDRPNVVEVAHDAWKKRVAGCTETFLSPELEEKLTRYIEQYR